MIPLSLRLATLLCLIAQACLASEGFSTNPAARVLGIEPFESARTFATAHGVPLTGFDATRNSTNVGAGDGITALVTLTEKGGRQRQWLLHTVLTEAARTNAQGVMTIYNSFGHQFKFPSSPAAVTLRTVGPFVGVAWKGKAPAVQDDTAKFDLDEGYLGLGLDRAAAAVVRTLKKKGRFSSGTVPVPSEEVAKSKAMAAEMNLTGAEERALGGSYPALLSYFNVVQHTDQLAEIMQDVIDRPSAFSLLTHLGIRSVEFAGHGASVCGKPPAAWGLVDNLNIYEMPMTLMLNQHPSLNITMIVTSPRPPLLACAGILGLLGEYPGKTEPSVTIRILSARVANNATAVVQ